MRAASITAFLVLAQAVDATPEPPAQKPALFPATQCKLLYLVRHAEGVHNEAKDNATRDKTHDPPYAVLFENTTGRKYWDAKLTPAGERQCDETRLKMLVSNDAFAEPELVLVSPLTRTLQSASRIFGAGTRPFIASELCREKVDVFICEGRRNVSELRSEFSHVDFSSVQTNEDSWFYSRKEDDQAVQNRARELVHFLLVRPERAISVVSHKHFLRNFMIVLGSSPEQAANNVFENAEIRSFQLCSSPQVDDMAATVEEKTSRENVAAPNVEKAEPSSKKQDL